MAGRTFWCAIPVSAGKAVIIEIKVAKTYQGLEEKCDEALRQIGEQDYEAVLRQEGYQQILKYGVALLPERMHGEDGEIGYPAC